MCPVWLVTWQMRSFVLASFFFFSFVGRERERLVDCLSSHVPSWRRVYEGRGREVEEGHKKKGLSYVVMLVKRAFDGE